VSLPHRLLPRLAAIAKLSEWGMMELPAVMHERRHKRPCLAGIVAPSDAPPSHACVPPADSTGQAGRQSL